MSFIVRYRQRGEIKRHGGVHRSIESAVNDAIAAAEWLKSDDVWVATEHGEVAVSSDHIRAIRGR